MVYNSATLLEKSRIQLNEKVEASCPPLVFVTFATMHSTTG
jgi:hypothetical protein